MLGAAAGVFNLTLEGPGLIESQSQNATSATVRILKPRPTAAIDLALDYLPDGPSLAIRGSSEAPARRIGPRASLATPEDT
ncbi:unnamed protein product [Clonostachys byssicola]|uniref:Uncharacterized protein n=1 Tax=Clonostachys byssicola TaxID=160290 RepID=A0A9N9UUZ8_9HYPO|nr:unnamed protein product [Clonostachys byssicola]